MPKQRLIDLATMYDVEVGWRTGDGDGYVQVGIETNDRRAIIDHLAGGAIPREDLDRMLGAGELPAFTGLWSSLDRDGVNQLIRTLRRARDGAFGADA